MYRGLSTATEQVSVSHSVIVVIRNTDKRAIATHSLTA